MTDFDFLFDNVAQSQPADEASYWPETASTAQLAMLLGVNPRTVRELAERGVIHRCAPGRFPVFESVQNYIAGLREKAAGRAGSTLTDERIRVAKEQADKLELQNAALRGELVSVSDVRREWLTLATDLRSALLAISSRVAARMGLERESAAILESEIRLALGELPNE